MRLKLVDLERIQKEMEQQERDYEEYLVYREAEMSEHYENFVDRI